MFSPRFFLFALAASTTIAHPAQRSALEARLETEETLIEPVIDHRDLHASFDKVKITKRHRQRRMDMIAAKRAAVSDSRVPIVNPKVAIIQSMRAQLKATETTSAPTADSTDDDGLEDCPDDETTTTAAPTPTTTSASMPTTTTASASGATYTGMATYYSQGGVAGACGIVHSDNDLIVAIDSTLYQKGISSSYVSPLCGKKVQVTNPATGASSTFTVADECPTCEGTYYLDLSVGAFKSLEPNLDVGMFDITWSFLD